MEWNKLLSRKRIKHKGNNEFKSNSFELRSVFETDFDRILFSTPFRHLQDKTQVIPLSKTSFVHTRLTHSLETSVVGRSLGRKVSKSIIERNNLKEYNYSDFGAIVSAACLAHDIGNPPFGHAGERIIGEFFQNNETNLKKGLTGKEWEDLIKFEGNAQGFKILNNSNSYFNLSCATLGSFIKYPKESLPRIKEKNVNTKKFNIFQSEKEYFKTLTDELGLINLSGDGIYARHPLAFLVEAADDICYTIIDFEDGVNLNLIDYKLAIDLFIDVIGNDEHYNKLKLYSKTEGIAFLRAVTINKLIESVSSVFLDNESKLLNGDLTKPLLEYTDVNSKLERIIDISFEKIYHCEEVVQKEIAGYKILNQLMESFTKAIINQYSNNTSGIDSMLIKQIPNFEFYGKNLSKYEQLMIVCSFICGLTDTQATELSRLISGIY